MLTPSSPKWLEAASKRASFEWISFRQFRKQKAKVQTGKCCEALARWSQQIFCPGVSSPAGAIRDGICLYVEADFRFGGRSRPRHCTAIGAFCGVLWQPYFPATIRSSRLLFSSVERSPPEEVEG